MGGCAPQMLARHSAGSPFVATKRFRFAILDLLRKLRQVAMLVLQLRSTPGRVDAIMMIPSSPGLIIPAPKYLGEWLVFEAPDQSRLFIPRILNKYCEIGTICVQIKTVHDKVRSVHVPIDKNPRALLRDRRDQSLRILDSREQQASDCLLLNRFRGFRSGLATF